MAKQTFNTGDVLTANAMNSLQNTAMLGGSPNAKTNSYTLVAADAGTAITMSNAGATTITVNTGLFAAGDTVTILNIGAGTCTITAGTATVSKPTNATLALVQNAGGVLYFTATGAATFMPFDVGTAAVSTNWVGCAVSLSANQTLSNATTTAISWTAESLDTDGFHSTASNQSRFTIPSGKAGKYLIQGSIQYNTNSTGIRGVYIHLNGSITGGVYCSQFSASSALTTIINFNHIINLSVGDYLEVNGYQSSGGNLDVIGAATTNSVCTLTYLGA